MSRSTPASDFTRGIVRENPVFVTLLGLCPALAITNRVSNALLMGAAVTVVLLFSNLFASALRDAVPEKLRIPAYITVIAVLSTGVNLAMAAYIPAYYRELGIYAPLIAVNCVILGRADTFARTNGIGRSMLDALGMGIGFSLSLILISLIREVLGSGTITLFPVDSFRGVIQVPGLSAGPVRVVGFAAGAFLVFGYLKALFNAIAARRGLRGRREGENA